MRGYGWLLLALLACTLGAVAQPDVDAPLDGGVPPAGQDMQRVFGLMIMRSIDGMPAVQKVTPHGIFTVRHGVLLKSDPATLEPKGTLELFGALPAWPKDGKFANPGAEFMAGLDRARRAAMPNVAVEGKNVYLISGADFFCIDAETLKIKATATLFDPDPLLKLGNMLMAPNPMALMGDAGNLFVPAQIEPQGKSVVVMRGTRQLLIDAETGAVIARKELPDALTGTLIPDIKMPNMPPELAGLAAAPMPDDKAPVDGKQYLTIGTFVTAGGKQTLTTARGAFTLRGAEAAKLAADPTATTARVAIVGRYTKPADPATSAGTVDVQAYLVLTTAK